LLVNNHLIDNNVDRENRNRVNRDRDILDKKDNNDHNDDTSLSQNIDNKEIYITSNNNTEIDIEPSSPPRRLSRYEEKRNKYIENNFAIV